jgi:rsbT co-antagonist protein RsbR
MSINDGPSEQQLSPLSHLLDVVMQLAAGDFSARAVDAGNGDELDALAIGINMLVEEVVAKFAENDRLVQAVEQNMERLKAQHQTIMSLSTPSLAVWEGVLALPLIGMIDTARAQQLSRDLLQRVMQQDTDVVIMDVTGLAEMDTTTVRHLLDTVSALRLLGTKCVLTGLGSQNARKMATMDVELQDVAIRATLHDGLTLALSMTGRRIIDARIRAGGKR